MEEISTLQVLVLQQLLISLVPWQIFLSPVHPLLRPHTLHRTPRTPHSCPHLHQPWPYFYRLLLLQLFWLPWGLQTGEA